MQQVSFAPTTESTVYVDRTGGIEDKLWYSSDNVDQFKLCYTLDAGAVREKICQGTFELELGDVLGLEKIICIKSYYARRSAMKAAVLEEQTWQRLSREMMLRRGLGDVDRHSANIRLMRLADIAEKTSSWAKERASITGLTLQSDLRTKRAEQRPIQQGPAGGA